MLTTTLNQAIWSGMNFSITVILAMLLGIEDFGWFSMGLTLRQFGQSVLGALILTPLTVLSGEQYRDQNESFWLRVSLTKLLQILFWILVIIAIFIASIFASPAFSFVLFVVGALASDLQRRFSYIDGDLMHDLYGGIFNMIGSLLGIYLLHISDQLSYPNTFLLLGCINLLWVLIINRKIWVVPLQGIQWEKVIQMWNMGRWGLGCNMAGYICSRISTYYTLVLLGPTGVAVLELGRQLVNVVQVFILGMANYWQPKLAHLASQNTSNIYVEKVLQATGIQTTLGIIVLALVLPILPVLIPLLFPSHIDAYMSSIPIAWITSGALVFQLLWQHMSFSVVVLGKPQFSFYTRLVAAVILIPVGYLLTDKFGIQGAAWSWTLGEGIILIIIAYAFTQAIKYKRIGELKYAG